MKKTYLCPATIVVNLNVHTSILAGSPDGINVYKDKNASENVEVLSRQHLDVWGEDEEE